MKDTPTMPTISKSQAKDYAVRIIDFIAPFCVTHQEEYIEFLKGRAGFSDNARKELFRLQQYKPIIFFACAKVTVKADWIKQVEICEQDSLVAYLEWLKEQKEGIRNAEKNASTNSKNTVS